MYYEASMLILDLSKNRKTQIRKHLNDFIEKYKGFKFKSLSFADDNTVIFIWEAR